MNIIDIKGKSENLISKNLSNMALHQFKFRGFALTSAESVIQSVKYKNPYKQMYALTLTGFEAKREATNIDWKKEQNLYWFGVPMNREGVEYQRFLDEIYIGLLKNEEFKQYLMQSTGHKLIHSIGAQNPKDTVLTEFEFCNRLTSIREYVLLNKEYSEQDLRKYLNQFHDKYLSNELCCKALQSFRK